MARQVDLNRLNAAVANNPNNTLSSASLQNIIASSNPPSLTPAYIESVINNLLSQIDQVTGLNLLAFAQELETLLGGSGNLLTGFLALFGGFTGSSPILSQIISAAGGSGDALSDLEAAFSAFGTGVETLFEQLETDLGVTDPSGLSTYLQGIATSAATAIGNWTTLLSNIPGASTIAEVGTAISNAATNAETAATNFATLLESTAQTDIAAVGTYISTAASNTESFINGAVTALTGAIGNAFTPAQATAALQGTAATTAANSAALAALQTTVAGSTNGGLAVTVNFADYANSTSLPAAFTTTYFGGPVPLGITSGCAALQWPTSVTAAAEANTVYNVAPTTSDYQLISGTFPTGPSNPYGTVSGSNYLFGRSNLAVTTCVWANLGYNTVLLGCSVSGTTTTFTSASYTFNAGATYSLVCGTPANPRTLQLLCNGAVILSWTDTSTSLLGAGYRYGGFGDYGYCAPGFTGTPGTVFGANIPGTMSQWNILDNTTTSGVTQVSYGGTGAASLSGMIKGNGTAPFTAATPGVDYALPGAAPRVVPITSSATPTFSTDTTDLVTITALTAAITSMTSGMSGTLHDGQKLMVRIHSASALAITWGASYQSSGVATLPTVTVAGKTITVGLQYDAVAAKLVALAVDAVGY